MGITCYHAFDWLAIIAAIANLAGFGISIYTVIYVFERVAVGETHTLIYKSRTPFFEMFLLTFSSGG